MVAEANHGGAVAPLDKLTQLLTDVHASGSFDFTASLGKIAKWCDAQMQLWDDIHIVPISGPPIVTASGTIDSPDQLGPHDGYWWDIDCLVAWGFTAGTVTVTRNDANGEVFGQWTAPGSFTWGKKQRSLAPRDRLIFTATGVTGVVRIGGQATEVRSAYWPAYLT